jgi:hypothetical protein
MARATYAGFLLALLGCTAPPGAILLVRDAGSDAAVLRWKGGAATGDRVVARVGPDGATRWAADVGGGPTGEEAMAADAGSPWVVRSDPPALRAIEAATGGDAWTWSAPAGADPRFLLDGGSVYVWWDGAIARLDRATGAETWRRELPAMEGPDAAPTLGGVVVGDLRSFVLFDAAGTERLRAATYPDARCATAAGLVWTDPEQSSWLYGAAGARVPVAVEGRVRHGGGTYAGRAIVPVSAGGVARVASIGPDGSVGWSVDLAAGAHVALDDAAEWPVHVPFVVEGDGGRQLVYVDVAEGRVLQVGAATDGLAAAGRVAVGPASVIVSRQVLLRLGEGAHAEAVRLPGVETQAPAARVGATGAWIVEDHATRQIAWTSSGIERLDAADLARLGL